MPLKLHSIFQLSIFSFSFQILFHLLVKLGNVFFVLADAEDLIFLGCFVQGLLVRYGSLSFKNVSAGVGQEYIGLLIANL